MLDYKEHVKFKNFRTCRKRNMLNLPHFTDKFHFLYHFACLILVLNFYSLIQLDIFTAFCEGKAPLQTICYGITGDAALYSMFRKYPEVKPVPCPFKSAPFTFSYNKGSGDCSYPQSKAESCTDDSRLVLKYQACPDVPSTESNGNYDLIAQYLTYHYKINFLIS